MTKTELFTCSIYAYYIITHPKLLSTWLRLYELEESWQKMRAVFWPIQNFLATRLYVSEILSTPPRIYISMHIQSESCRYSVFRGIRRARTADVTSRRWCGIKTSILYCVARRGKATAWVHACRGLYITSRPRFQTKTLLTVYMLCYIIK